jgi:hypothetical protein
MKMYPDQGRFTSSMLPSLNHLLRVGLFLALSAAAAGAQTTLISDSFSFTGELNGHTPDTTVGGVSWVAPSTNLNASYPNANGSTLSVANALTQTDTLNLGAGYFASNPGVYTLSMDLSFASGGTGTGWVGLGFVNAPAITGTMSGSSGEGGSPWLLYRANGDVRVFGGLGTANSLFGAGTYTFANGANHNFKLVLDTSSSQWTLDAFVDGTQLDLNGAATGDMFTYSANPPSTLGYVGISASPSAPNAVGAVDNFSLTESVVPEPSAVALSLVAVFAFVARKGIFRNSR